MRAEQYFLLFLEYLPGITTLLAAVYAVIEKLRRIRKLKEQEKKIHEAEKVVETVSKEESFVNYIEGVLKLASERERLTMLQAQGRSSGLFVVGTILMLLSVFTPLISIYAYVESNPLTSEALLLLKSLKEQVGIVPDAKEIISQRDWRILFSGVSFGFLFLAAARGIFRQEGQQMATFLNLARRVRYYENIISAVKIAERNERLNKMNDEEKTEPSLSKLVNSIIDLLIKPPFDEAKEEELSAKKDSSDGLPLKEQAENIIKSLK
jgi:hypothetical protein